MKPAVLVIGAGDALGGAIAKRFAREGFATCVTRRNVDKLDALKTEIEAAGGICRRRRPGLPLRQTAERAWRSQARSQGG